MMKSQNNNNNNTENTRSLTQDHDNCVVRWLWLIRLSDFNRIKFVFTSFMCLTLQCSTFQQSHQWMNFTLECWVCLSNGTCFVFTGAVWKNRSSASAADTELDCFALRWWSWRSQRTPKSQRSLNLKLLPHRFLLWHVWCHIRKYFKWV